MRSFLQTPTSQNQRRAGPARAVAPLGTSSLSGVRDARGSGLPLFLQPKLAISRPGDPYEQEADRVADQVMRMPAPTVQRQCAACAAGGPPCQACEEERVQVSRKAHGSAGSEAPASVHSVLLSPGQPLPVSTRAFFEPRFGQDLSHVRVHTDGGAQQSAHDVNALAYTVGSHVVFDAGRYAPHSTEGQRLLAHELTHVVQQSQGDFGIQRKSQEAGVCDPANLRTLGPNFRKPEADVSTMGLKEKYVIQRPASDDDFVLYCPHKSTRPLKKLVPCTKVYWLGDAEASGKGRGKDEVWAQLEGESDLFWGYIKKVKAQDIPCERTGVTTVEHVRPAPSSEEFLNVNECDDASFCQPLPDPTAISLVKARVTQNLNDLVFPILTDEAVGLWNDFLNRRPGDDMTPKVFTSPDSPLAEKFGNDDMTTALQEEIIKNIVQNSQKQAIDVYKDRPIFYRVGLLADRSVLTRPLEFESVLGAPNTALTAGGAGGTDRREVIGDIAIEPSVKNDITNEQNYRISTKLRLIVQDTIDFCPGKCGAWLEQKVLTIDLSRLEASGAAYDVPFEIHADIPGVGWDYLETDLNVRVLD